MQFERNSKDYLDKKEPLETRCSATVRIWCIAAMMLICSLAASLGHSEVVFWAIFIGALVGTAATWGFFNGFGDRHLPQTKTQEELEEMKQRLANVETVVSYEERVAESRNRRVEIAD